MATSEREERIAALLCALGPEVAQHVMTSLPESTSQRVQQFLDQFQEDPLDDEELEDVLDEFIRFFRFAMQNEAAEAELAKEAKEQSNQASKPPRVAETKPEKKPFVPTGDALKDLLQLEPFQIAGALKEEKPKTIAIVLSCLPSQQAGLALQMIPENVRPAVFLTMRSPPRTPSVMLERIVRTTVAKGCVLDANAVIDPADEANQKMAELLRAMDQSQRAEMLRALETQDAQMVAEIKKLLYTFEDLKNVANRSVQKILGEIDSQSLALALKGVDAEVFEKIMTNLSKRARATLAEEIEFLGHVKPAEQESARQAICEIIARLDEAGDLEMESP